MMTASGVALANTAVYGALAVCFLIVLLIAKELLSAYGEEGEAKRSGGRAAEEAEGGTCVTVKSLAQNLSAAIYPLLFCFTLIVVVTVMGVL
jgi:hypothetical protein